MKTLKTYFALALTLVLIYSCEKEESTDTPEVSEVPEAVIQKFHALGVNTVEGVKEHDMEGEKGWLTGDIFLSKEDIISMTDLPTKAGNEKLYRTRGLVRVPNNGRRTITVKGRNNLPANAKTGLRRAVANFNNLNLKFRMRLSFGSGGANVVVVYRPNNSASGAAAGFPRNGNPFNRVQIFGGLARASVNVMEGIMTHELGHCVGLRHSDFRTRSSCRGIASTGNEGQGQFGAVFIPGTDRSGRSTNSVMRACNPFTNFTSQDRTGLRRIY